MCAHRTPASKSNLHNILWLHYKLAAISQEHRMVQPSFITISFRGFNAIANEERAKIDFNRLIVVGKVYAAQADRLLNVENLFFFSSFLFLK